MVEVRRREKESTGSLLRRFSRKVQQSRILLEARSLAHSKRPKSKTKKRKDSIFEYEKAGRADLAKTEQAELAILEGYLPKELSDEEIQRVVKDGMRELEATGDKSFGALMKVVMPSLKGRASGDRISKIAREALESH